ncbi:MAG: ABC transporter permease subunit [Gemmatimonadetes bacterium]|nr:ABC transporter permease subunit [Gemmatimonadota bacterium]
MSPDRYGRPSWLQRHPQLIWLLLLVPATAYLAVFFAYPVIGMLGRSLWSPEFTLEHYARLFGSPAYLRILWTTLRISMIVAVVALLLGYPAAFVLSRAPERVAHWLLALVLLPFWTSVLVRSYAWIVILGSEGLVNRALQTLGLTAEPVPLVYNELGVVTGMVQVLLPYMILPLYGVMRGIDQTHLRAASSLGAGFWPSFRLVYLPLSMPGVTAGFLLVFVLSIGFFVTPALLGGGRVEMIALQIDTQVNELVDWGFGAALAAALLFSVIAIVALFIRFLDPQAFGLGAPAAFAPTDEDREPAAAGQRPPGDTGFRSGALSVRSPGFATFARPQPRYAWWAGVAFTAGVLMLLVAPVLIIVPMSFGTTAQLAFPPKGFTLRWYHHYLTDPSWMAATGLSLQVAALTSAGALVLGTLAAIGLVRGGFRRAHLWYLGILAPMIVPAIVSAVAVYFLFVRLRLVGSLWSFVLAHLVLAIPVVVVVVSAALRRVDRSLESAATVLGAHPIRAFFAVTFPAIRPAVVAALLFAFITSLDEIVMALFLAGTTSATLPAKMWESLRFQIDPTIAAISTLLILLSLLVLLGASARMPKRRVTGTA